MDARKMGAQRGEASREQASVICKACGRGEVLYEA